MEPGRRDAGAEELKRDEREECGEVGAAPAGLRREICRLPPRLKGRIVFSARRPTRRSGYFLAKMLVFPVLSHATTS